MFIGGLGTFECEVFVFVVINKVMHIMNIFVRNSQHALISKVCLLSRELNGILLCFSDIFVLMSIEKDEILL